MDRDTWLIFIALFVIACIHLSLAWQARETADYNQVRIEIIEEQLGIGP